MPALARTRPGVFTLFTALAILAAQLLAPPPVQAIHCPGGYYKGEFGEVCLFPIEGDTQHDYYFRFKGISNKKQSHKALYDLFLVLGDKPATMDRTTIQNFKSKDPCFFSNGVCIVADYLGETGVLRTPDNIAVTANFKPKLTIAFRISDYVKDGKKPRYGPVAAVAGTVDLGSLSKQPQGLDYANIKLEWDEAAECQMVQRYIGGGLSVSVRHVADYTWAETKGLTSNLPSGYVNAAKNAKKINKGKYYQPLLIQHGAVNVHKVHEYEISIDEGNYRSSNVASGQEFVFFNGTKLNANGRSKVPADTRIEPAVSPPLVKWNGAGLCDNDIVAIKTKSAITGDNSWEPFERFFQFLEKEGKRFSAGSVQPGKNSLVTLSMVPFQPGEERPFFESGFKFSKFAIKGPNGNFLKYEGTPPDGRYTFTEPERDRASCFVWFYREGESAGDLYTSADPRATCAQSFPAPTCTNCPENQQWKSLRRILPMTNFRESCDSTRYLQFQPVDFGKPSGHFSLYKVDGKSCYHDDPLICRFHGTPTSKTTCTCNPGYQGANCESCAPGYRYYKYADHAFTDCIPCPDCGPHGTCDVYSYKDNLHACRCEAGYTGPNCQYSRQDTCSNHGTPDISGICVCDPGYAGQNYGGTTKGCWAGRDLTCNGHGDADPANPRLCICDNGYGGANCQLSRAATCNGHGMIEKTAYSWKCTCDQGYGGDNCQFSSATSCNQHGMLVPGKNDGSCTCNKGYGGRNCQLSDAVTCNRHGTVTQGIYGPDDWYCKCEQGYLGDRCEFPKPR